MDYFFKGGRVYTAGGIVSTDVLVLNGKIAAMGSDITVPNYAEIISSEGCLLSPSFCDLHVHFRQPGYEHKETIKSGSMAAAAGGFTTVCTMPNLAPVPHNAENMQVQLDAICADAVIEVLPYAAISVNEKGESAADIDALALMAVGFSDDGVGVQSRELMLEAMRKIAAKNNLVAAHCEVNSELPSDKVCIQQGSTLAKKNGWQGVNNKSEWLEVERNIELVRKTGCRLHICHASTAETFKLVLAAAKEGLPVTCELSPHNLLLSCEEITGDSARFKMNPPLRTPQDVKAAVELLQDAECCAIATDHAPHTAEEKAGGFTKAMNGIVGLETAFPVLYTKLVMQGFISLERLVRCMAEVPCEILRRDVPKIEVGKEANLVLLALEKAEKVCPEKFITKGRATPFDGWQLYGWPKITLYKGEKVWQKQI